MAKKTIDMEEAFSTMPELPLNFEKNCIAMTKGIPVFYKRKGKTAECICGKCGMQYETTEKPVRDKRTVCPMCGNKGFWEWSKVTTRRYEQKDITLIQCTNDGNLVIRLFRVHNQYKQYYIGETTFSERRRYFLHMGDVYKFYRTYKWTSKGREEYWGKDPDREPFDMSDLYPGWRCEIEKSKLKYCNLEEITNTSPWLQRDYVKALLAYANNPALEMYAKAGLKNLVWTMIQKEGKTKLVNRRAKTLYSQLRIENKVAFHRFQKSEGDTFLLQILQKEKKRKIKFTDEQIEFLRRRDREWRGTQKVEYLLRFMTLQKLMNRVQKYIAQGDYIVENQVVGAYHDYLEMREDLGYDMTNEIYLYPKNLKEKHDQMVEEKRGREDELHETKMNIKYPKIEMQYNKLFEKYGFTDECYVIRPAMNAGEIVKEGRDLHHCVGRETYLSKHNSGQTVILFLRKAETPNVPYYTIEIRDKEIIQWYGIRDTKPDKEIIEVWLEDYVSYLRNTKSIRKEEKEMLLMAAC